MAVEVSIIIPTLNEEKNVVKCLQSLSAQTVPREKYELIVSDSFSKDNTVEVAKGLADKVVESEAKGAGAARNFGVEHAMTHKVAFIDADTLAKETYVEGVMEILEHNVAATGPLESLEKDSWWVNLFFDWWSFQDWASIKLGFPIFPGFNIAVRKSPFKKAGGFGKRDYTCEDIDLGLKLHKLGSIGYSEKMRVLTSTRRIREKTVVPYVLNAWNFVLFKRSRTWAQHRPAEELVRRDAKP